MSAPDELRSALPDYEVGDELGRGGFGRVWSGRHRHLGREVAIKELPASLANDPGVRARFAAEARVLASLSHPHIVPIYDYVEREGQCLLVMEKLPGGTVWDHFKSRGFTQETACAVVMATCAGLHYAHQHNVLHRDVKPENLLFSADPVLRITDFGIAKVVGGNETLATRGGDILGTPAYIAPEQASGKELGPPADVFATGVLLYELLSGRLPYEEEGGALAIVYRHVYEDPIPLRDVAPQVLPHLAQVTMRALERSPADRWQSAEAFGVALGAAVTPSWGVGWLASAETPVVDPGPISTSAQRPTDPLPEAGTAEATGRRGDGRETIQVPVTPPEGTPPPTPSTPRATPHATPYAPSQPERVRPMASGHLGAGEHLVDAIAGGAAVPIQVAIQLPPKPVSQTLAAIALAILMVIVALVGVGSPDLDSPLPRGAVTIAGQDAASVPSVDLSEPFEVQFRDGDVASGTEIELAISVVGVPLGTSSRAAVQSSTASVNVSSSRFLVPGQVTGELRVLSGDEVTSARQFTLQSDRSGLLTVPGALGVAMVMFLVAYVESLFKPLRRGKSRIIGTIGLVGVGAGLGVASIVLSWVIGDQEPTITAAVACAVLGAAAGVALALAGNQMGRRHRIRPKVRAAERAAARARAG